MYQILVTAGDLSGNEATTTAGASQRLRRVELSSETDQADCRTEILRTKKLLLIEWAAFGMCHHNFYSSPWIHDLQSVRYAQVIFR